MALAGYGQNILVITIGITHIRLLYKLNKVFTIIGLRRYNLWTSKDLACSVT
jgi:hypothetical protein